MKKAVTKSTAAMALLCLTLVGCENIEDTVAPEEPMKVSQAAEMVGLDPSTCNLMRLAQNSTSPSLIQNIEEDGAQIQVTAQKRGHNGKYLNATPAVVLDPRIDGAGLMTPMEARIISVPGIITVGDGAGTAVNNNGGRLVLDFSSVGSVTLKAMLIADIDSDEKGSKVELYSSNGQLLYQKELPVTGDLSSTIIGLGNTPKVTKMVVTFGNERTKVGSGAIGLLQMCVEGQGQRNDYCTDQISSVWMEYTGRTPANVNIRSVAGASSKVIFSQKGMKPGTMFKLYNYEGLGEALVVETNKKERQTISLDCSKRPVPIKEEYGSFRVVQAGTESSPYSILLQ